MVPIQFTVYKLNQILTTPDQWPGSTKPDHTHTPTFTNTYINIHNSNRNAHTQRYFDSQTQKHFHTYIYKHTQTVVKTETIIHVQCTQTTDELQEMPDWILFSPWRITADCLKIFCLYTFLVCYNSCTNRLFKHTHKPTHTHR